ncbi:hypothetical protein Poli38472_010046 [Pythium oligandrum]|uniref:Protein kinase domain-containing protein n=1 Tax=Pythium oligandrum TaxID=41045 RepID=A0A8K1FGA0_PYTOL|nr:hypothetical protein Poli38472_010046 [Pythium oligandrum]|eukprot:TMW58487.1 hypothetical protein Poli38472_010046 [Pythium oligandrum]
MYPSWSLTSTLGSDFQVSSVIHVLAMLPPQQISPVVASAKRKREEDNVSLADLWEYSRIKIEELPNATALKDLLLRPLPFRLQLYDTAAAEQVFDQNGEMLECPELLTTNNTILMECALSRSTAGSWQSLYDALFRLPHHINAAKEMGISFCWNRGDVVDPRKDRPHLLVHFDDLVILRGEEEETKPFDLGIDLDGRNLIRKMGSWNSLFYGDLPYILAYYACGRRFVLVTIVRSLVSRRVVEFDSLTWFKADAIKVFYNLAFFLKTMRALHGRARSCPLTPYTPGTKETSTIELMDGVVRRTRHSLCKMEYERLIDTYTNLQEVQRGAQERTHLQTVRKLLLPDHKNPTLTVYLEPVGYMRVPYTIEEFVEWLRAMLTALKYWHDRNFCHGDIHWRNIVYAPTDGPGYWVLIDMDQSYRPNTKAIDWNHAFHREKPVFRHDLFQLGRLLESVMRRLMLSSPSQTRTRLETIQNLLLSAATDQELIACRMLVLLDDS